MHFDTIFGYYMQRPFRIYFWIQSTIFGSTKKSTVPKTFLPIFDVFYICVYTFVKKNTLEIYTLENCSPPPSVFFLCLYQLYCQLLQPQQYLGKQLFIPYFHVLCMFIIETKVNICHPLNPQVLYFLAYDLSYHPSFLLQWRAVGLWPHQGPHSGPRIYKCHNLPSFVTTNTTLLCHLPKSPSVSVIR